MENHNPTIEVENVHDSNKLCTKMDELTLKKVGCPKLKRFSTRDIKCSKGSYVLGWVGCRKQIYEGGIRT